MKIIDKENYEQIWNSISMKNLHKVIISNDYTLTKVAINSKVSDSTIISYIPLSLPPLISIADFLNVNIDYLLDRTKNK